MLRKKPMESNTKRIYNKIVGRTKKNNHENLIKKSFYI